MQLFVIHSAGLFEGPEVHWRSRGANVHGRLDICLVSAMSNCYSPSMGGKLNEFSSDDLCLFARVLLLSCDAGFYTEVT